MVVGGGWGEGHIKQKRKLPITKTNKRKNEGYFFLQVFVGKLGFLDVFSGRGGRGGGYKKARKEATYY